MVECSGEDANLRIGTAGWSISRAVAHQFPEEGSALERYAALFCAVEINSSFHRPHRFSTWARWKEATPPGFRFAAKIPKLITHQQRLVGCEAALDEFVDQVGALDEKLSVLLVQLPPSLAFSASTAAAFFIALSARASAAIVCEPRHPSWFESDADDLLVSHKVARAAADPSLSSAAAMPGGWSSLAYWRLHGSPVMYRSSYADRLPYYAELIGRSALASETWCMFDNTASSAALADALKLEGLLQQEHPFTKSF